MLFIYLSFLFFSCFTFHFYVLSVIDLKAFRQDIAKRSTFSFFLVFCNNEKFIVTKLTYHLTAYTARITRLTYVRIIFSTDYGNR